MFDNFISFQEIGTDIGEKDLNHIRVCSPNLFC